MSLGSSARLFVLVTTITSLSSACAARVAPEVAVVTPRPSAFGGDTLVVAFADRREDRTASTDAGTALIETLRKAYPAATVRAVSMAAPEGTPGALQLTVSLDRYGVDFHTGMKDNWRAMTALTTSVIDRRHGTDFRTSTRVSGAATKSNWKGPQSGGEAARASFDEAARALLAFVDVLGDPAAVRTLVAQQQVAEAEYTPYLSTSGTGTIEGQAFLTTRGGDVKLGAGRVVTLDPATRYANDWFAGGGGASIEAFDDAPPHPTFSRARRTTTSDAQGRFRFTGLPAGTYILRSTVTWEIPTGRVYVATTEMQGGVVSDVVSLGAGERREVILNKVVSRAP